MYLRQTLAFGLCVMALAGTAAAQTPEITPGDNLVIQGIPKIPASLASAVGRYGEFRAASFTSWHPVRREMLISTRFGDSSQLHLVKMPGGARTQLTFFPEPVRGGSFRPGRGDCFIFPKDIGGSEFYQLFRHDLASGDVTLLTDGKSRNSSPAWSADGKRIAYTSTRRNGKDTDIYVMDPSDTKTDRCVAELAGGGWGVLDWSPDGKTLSVEEEISINESYLWLVDVESGKRTLLTPKGGEKTAYAGAQFTTDGKAVYTATDRGSEFMRLGRINLANGAFECLTEQIPWNIESFAVSKDGRWIAFVSNEDAFAKLHLMDAASGREKPVPALPAGTIGGLEWHENNVDLGFAVASARSTADAYSINVTTGQLDRWTTSETGGLNPENFVEPKLIRWKSFDGQGISGLLYTPPAKYTGKRPVIINIHGGPESQARPMFLGRYNYYLNELGVAVIFPNIRGSSGYGKSFLLMDNGFKREDSYKDIGALLDWIKTQPQLDAERIMVTGGSYGGHMTFAIATLYSDRIRATLPVVGMSNLVTFLERTESYRRDLRRVEYGDERDPKMREFLERIAPLNNTDKIRVPMFIVQGANDPRVPASESDQMARKLKGNKVPVWYLLAKDEGHGFAKKRNQDFQFYSTIMFVREYLLTDR